MITVDLEMKPKMTLIVQNCSKFFFTGELVELIVRETNTQNKKCELEVSFKFVPECGTGDLSLKAKCLLG
jgi:hypothetical protein